MRSTVLHLGSVLVVAASLGQPQASTADGVDAFVRGDYQRAVEILQPLAESWPSRDHVAEFLMATLYESGHGVPADPLRACALYVRASLDSASPIGPQAMALMRSFHRSLSAEQFQTCVRMANTGFDHGFQPATFTLEQGHWITIDLEGATISYEGKEKRTALGLARNGVRFLPVEHSELTAGPALSTRRHFIEFFIWLPSQPNLTGQTWTLMWRVFEVVRNDLVGVTSAPLLTVSAAQPPTDSSIDVHEMARVRVNEQGHVEWAVLKGPNQRSEVIESDSERQERSERARTRADAEARVDWTRAKDPRREPALAYSDADGCANTVVYGWSDDRSEVIEIRADKDRLGLSTGPRTFDVASQRADLVVLVHVYERPVRRWPFCTDVVDPRAPEETWRVTRGTVTIELSAPGVVPRAPFLYRATIRIVGAEVVSATGVRVRQMQPITLSAIVGGMSG
jgi:hypothetical protein